MFKAMELAKRSTMAHQMGCCIMKGRKVVASDYNCVIGTAALVSKHAEMGAIEDLLRSLGLLKRFRFLLLHGQRKVCSRRTHVHL
jgi:tRNA(Arg) A34 adenosine deaminase TadA